MSSATYIILDTEFTDFTNMHLISIGLITVDGKHEFYRELSDYPTHHESHFVKHVVVPLLDMPVHGKPTNVIASELNRWLEQFSNVVLLVDYPGDVHLFNQLMASIAVSTEHIAAGFVTSTMLSASKTPIDDEQLLNRLQTLQKEYYTLIDGRQHHALVDVKAYQYAWEWLVER